MTFFLVWASAFESPDEVKFVAISRTERQDNMVVSRWWMCLDCLRRGIRLHHLPCFNTWSFFPQYIIDPNIMVSYLLMCFLIFIYHFEETLSLHCRFITPEFSKLLVHFVLLTCNTLSNINAQWKVCGNITCHFHTHKKLKGQDKMAKKMFLITEVIKTVYERFLFLINIFYMPVKYLFTISPKLSIFWRTSYLSLLKTF